MRGAGRKDGGRGGTALGRLSALGGLLVASLLALELLLRLSPERALGYRHEAGFLLPPHEPTRHEGVNSLGFHDVEPATERAARRRVLLLGDERIAGAGLPLADGLARRLAARLEERAPGRFDVVLAAREGWGPREQIEALRAHAARLRPEVVLVCFDPRSDVREAAGLLRAFGAAGGPASRLETRALPGLVLPFSELNRTLSFRLAGGSDAFRRASGPPETALARRERPARWERAFEEALSVLGGLRDEAERRGCELTVVFVPGPFEALEPEAARAELLRLWPELAADELEPARLERDLERECRRRAIPFASLAPRFRSHAGAAGEHFFAPCAAWTAAGHALAAEGMAELVLERAR